MKKILVSTTLLMALGFAPLFAAEEPAVKEEKPVKWEKTAAVGLTLTSGNSDTLLFTANALGVKKWRKNELSLGANMAYGEDSSVVNNQTFGAFGQYDRLINEKLFGYGRVEALHDAIADVDLRLTIGPGAGYFFIKNDKTNLRAEIGPSFVIERLGTGDDSFATLRVAEKFTHKLGEKARLW